MDPVEDRTVFRLLAELTERPELYDFLFGSGVARDEEGVEILRGNMDGDREDARTSAFIGSG